LKNYLHFLSNLSYSNLLLDPSFKDNRPELGSYNFRMHFPTVVFPDPLSPTSPKVSPFLIKKLTLQTAPLFLECWISNLFLQENVFYHFLSIFFGLKTALLAKIYIQRPSHQEGGKFNG